MSVKRLDLIKYLEQNGFSLLREGKKHAISTPREKGPFRLRGAAGLTELLLINFASKRAWSQSSDAVSTSLAILHLMLLDKVGARLDSFGDSRGKVDEVFEPVMKELLNALRW